MSNSQGTTQNRVTEILPETNGTGVAPLPRNGASAKLQASAEALRVLPAEFVKRHRVLPLGIQDGTIHIATSDPGNQRIIDDIRLLSGLEVRESEAPQAEILERIAECYQVTVEQVIE